MNPNNSDLQKAIQAEALDTPLGQELERDLAALRLSNGEIQLRLEDANLETDVKLNWEHGFK